jgi:hypothetical protein
MIVQISLANCRIVFLKNAAVEKTRAVSDMGNHCQYYHSSKPKLLIPSL